MRARLAIAASGMSVELREVVLRDKPPQLQELSPKATVPVVLTLSGEVIEESLDIMFWALGHNDPENWLPSDGDEKREVFALIERCDTFFKPQLDKYKYASRLPQADGISARNTASEFLLELDQLLEKQQWLFSNKVGLADMAIITFVRQFANVDRSWFDNQNWPNLSQWLEKFLNSDRFTSIMNKYDQWQSGDESILLSAGISSHLKV